jgi:hypothetical protein
MSIDSNPRSTDEWAHVAIAQMMVCPMCFGAVAKQATRENREIMLATYVCENQHLFEVRWGLAQVTA